MDNNAQAIKNLLSWVETARTQVFYLNNAVTRDLVVALLGRIERILKAEG